MMLAYQASYVKDAADVVLARNYTEEHRVKLDRASVIVEDTCV